MIQISDMYGVGMDCFCQSSDCGKHVVCSSHRALALVNTEKDFEVSVVSAEFWGQTKEQERRQRAKVPKKSSLWYLNVSANEPPNSNSKVAFGIHWHHLTSD
jgi:hypothetical protein